MAMKLRFEADLDYQADAVEAVCGLFKGQEFGHSEFTVLPQYPVAQAEIGIGRSALGVGNRLSLSDGGLLGNLNDVQIRNGLEPSRSRGKIDALVDGVKYQKVGDGEYYAQELFETQELVGYLKNMLTDTRKSAYEEVVFDSQNEERFARQLELSAPIKVYAKLPGWFQAPTPLGPYNPDWAVVVQDENGAERLYFVVDTKGSSLLSDLRRSEAMKAKWGEAHFEALREAGSSAKYVVAKDFDEFTRHW